MPVASAARAVSAAKKYRSAKQVVPEASISAQAARAPRRTASGVSRRSAGQMCSVSQTVTGRSFGQAAKQGHGRVGVDVHQAGQEHGPAQIDGVVRDEGGRDAGARSHGRDAAGTYGHGPVVDDLPGGILGDDA
jgi:hypothetical protein